MTGLLSLPAVSELVHIWLYVGSEVVNRGSLHSAIVAAQNHAQLL